MLNRLIVLIILSLSIIVSHKVAFCQKADSSLLDRDTIQYKQVNTADLFAGYDTDNLVIDYYFTSGFSEGDRFSYEFILTDNLLTVTFNSPFSDSYNSITYKKESYVSDDDLNKLESAIFSCGLKQVRNGIPQPNATGYEQEVLILKFNYIKLSGGLFSYTITDNADTAAFDKQREQDRKRSSSIGGDYDKFFNILDGYFPELNCLLGEVERED
jgi:hypothetical protein